MTHAPVAGRRRVLRFATLTVLAITLPACLGAGLRGGIHARMGYSEAGGLRVVDVPRDGPAYRAGLRPGDRIITLEGEPIGGLNLDEIVARLRGPVGTTIELEVVRDGEAQTLIVPRVPYDPPP